MSDKEQNKWKRKVPTRIYDYNYKVGESYYNPQKEFIENREFLTQRKAPPPEAQTYAERFASRPFYGKAHGLPYGDEEAQRPFQRRAASAGRARDRASRESDDLPSAGPRAGRARDRTLSFNDDDFDLSVKKALKNFSLDDDLAAPRRTKFSLDDDSDFRVPVRRASTSIDRDLAAEFAIRPENKSELMKKFKALEREFEKANAMERGATSRKVEHNAWNDELSLPGRRSVKRDEVSYTDPDTGAKVHKSSYKESSKFESSSSSSKPPHLPRPPRPSRLLSVDSDSDFKVPSRPRNRRISLGDISSDDMDIRSLASKALGHIRDAGADFESKKFRGAREIRDLRRAKESEELTANINKIIKKMRNHDEGDVNQIKVSRTFRSSSLEPLQRETIVRASPSHRFVYGISRI